MITSNHSDIILKQVGERSLQEIQIAEWKTQQETSPLKQLILIMDDKSNRINETLPYDSKLTREMGVSNCFKKAKIGGYEFGSSCICKTEKNSYCIFKYQNTLKFGSIEYIAEANGEIFVQLQPYHCEPLNNLQEIEFENYFTIGKKLGEPIICNSKLIHKKGLVITQNVVHIFVPLAHVYEHN
jgi:hypothetical protein